MLSGSRGSLPGRLFRDEVPISQVPLRPGTLRETGHGLGAISRHARESARPCTRQKRVPLGAGAWRVQSLCGQTRCPNVRRTPLHTGRLCVDRRVSNNSHVRFPRSSLSNGFSYSTLSLNRRRILPAEAAADAAPTSSSPCRRCRLMRTILIVGRASRYTLTSPK
jgi:hypothetical protein